MTVGRDPKPNHLLVAILTTAGSHPGGWLRRGAREPAHQGGTRARREDPQLTNTTNWVAKVSGTELDIVEGGLDGAEGRSVTGAGAGIIRIRRGITQLERRRFVIAHEIGHCILHKTGSVRPCSEGDLFQYEEGIRRRLDAC